MEKVKKTIDGAMSFSYCEIGQCEQMNGLLLWLLPFVR